MIDSGGNPWGWSQWENPFAGIHQLSWFDLAIIVPYFVLIGLLGLYGIHRYVTLWRYLRCRNRPAPPPPPLERLPRVTIQLPLYNERFVVERLLEAVTKIRYPRELLQIQVLDDSTDDTRQVCEQLVRYYQSQGVPIEYHHREHRYGYKAGALAEGLKTATGELIAIFDADFVPGPDFLERTVPYFADPQVGLVQTRWGYLNRDYNLLTEVQAMLLDGHFILEHTARQGYGLYFNFNGTAGVLRRAMIEDAGGWEHDTLTEDSDLSYRAQLKGWKFIYLPEVVTPSELPVAIHAFQVQQARWAKGLTQVALKLLPRILRAPIPLKCKIEAFFHLTPNISYPMMIIVSALMVPVMIVRFYIGWLQMLTFDVPFIIITMLSLFFYYVLPQHAQNPASWKRALLRMPALLALGISLTLINAKAVIEALLGIQSPFARTAKYAIAGSHKRALKPVRYRRRSGWWPAIEIAAGSYFAVMINWAIGSHNYMAVPILALFTWGYWWAGFGTLIDEFRAKLAWERSAALQLEPAES